jgi:cysteinyl-tRNA synthetase
MTDGPSQRTVRRPQFFNSMTRTVETLRPLHPVTARVYSCGPTVYSFQHIGNMRAYIFTDTLGRALTFAGLDLTHIINITDVGHLTSDADTGEDKLEKASAREGRSAYEIARFYTGAFWHDLERLNVIPPSRWVFASQHVTDMIAFAEKIAPRHCYLLESGLYFDTSTVPSYGSLAGSERRAGEGRIEEVSGKRNPADFAIWRRSKPKETRQMEWNSPWGPGAPGWHLECSVMSMKYLGEHFDIHTGGIDHREIHHPNEIAQNQAYTETRDSGATIWMHNNFLIDRSGKLSKSAGGALLLEDLVGRGYHPIAFRLMCLQAHYRSPLEFSFPNLDAALARLKRLVNGVERLQTAAQAGSPATPCARENDALERFALEITDDLMTPRAIPVLEEALGNEDIPPPARLRVLRKMDEALGLRLGDLSRKDLRVRPADARLQGPDVEARVEARRKARAEKNFLEADRIRAELENAGVDVKDGDPLAWEWRIETPE